MTPHQGPGGVRAPTDHAPDATTRPRGQPRSAVRELGRFTPRLVAGSLLVAGVEALIGTALDEPALSANAVLSAGFGLSILGADILIRIGRARWVGALLAACVYLLGLAGAILIPGAAPASAMLPILSVVLLLPGRGRRGIAAILAVCLAGSALALMLSNLPHPFPAMREPIDAIFESTMMLGVALLILAALTDYAMQAEKSLDELRRTMHAQDLASAERTTIMASLGKLERRDTIKATAELIVDALMKLPDIDLAGVLAAQDGQVEVLAVRSPSGFPLKQGDRLPAPRARYLLDRMSGGPWAERWTNDPAYDQYSKAFTAAGIKGQAFAPFFDGDIAIGAIAIGTRSDAQADHFIADVPAVEEFAATASLLLTPLLLARRDRLAGRDAIEEIIASRAYRSAFQPIVELATGRAVGFEALTRFTDGRRPDIVFGAAAQAGLGLELELGTLESAIRKSHELPKGTWLSLNVSPRLLVEADGLARVLADRDRPIVLEITEHVLIEDYRAVRAAIDRLGADVRVAVDDAGAGIANFSHLVELRPRLVKVDAGLIRDLDTDLARQAVVVGLVHFAAKAGCEVIAEGIETTAERATAKALGVTHGQGYLIARPAPVETFIPEAAATRAPRAKRATRARRAIPTT